MELTLNLAIDEDIRNLVTVKSFVFDDDKPGAIHKISFPDGYGLIVNKHKYSKGYEQNLWEMALSYRGRIDPDILEARGTIGCATDEQVNDMLRIMSKIKR